MKKFIKCLLVLVAALMMCGSAYAYHVDEHMNFAANGKGDLIVIPAYVGVAGGWETKICVVNTSEVYSSVAKIVFRSYVFSEELLDFLIYLSPNDMWCGVISWDGQRGCTRVYSEDGSTQTTGGAWASAQLPLDQCFFSIDCPMQDSQSIGYAEIIEAAAFEADNPIFAPCGDLMGPDFDTKTPVVSKPAIYNIYHKCLDMQDAVDSPIDCGHSLTPGGEVAGSSCFPPLNILASWFEIALPVAGWNSSARSYVFKDYINTQQLGVGQETFIGAFAENNILEVEAAMAKDCIATRYVETADAVTIKLTNFPTKLTETVDGSNANKCACLHDGSMGPPMPPRGGSPFWTGICCLELIPEMFDIDEHTSQTDPFSGGGQKAKYCDELNFWVGFPFPEGWIRQTYVTGSVTGMTKDGLDEITYYGAPSIVYNLIIDDDTMVLEESAYDWGEVWGSSQGVGFNELIDYHVTDMGGPGFSH